MYKKNNLSSLNKKKKLCQTLRAYIILHNFVADIWYVGCWHLKYKNDSNSKREHGAMYAWKLHFFPVNIFMVWHPRLLGCTTHYRVSWYTYINLGCSTSIIMYCNTTNFFTGRTLFFKIYLDQDISLTRWTHNYLNS